MVERSRLKTLLMRFTYLPRLLRRSPSCGPAAGGGVDMAGSLQSSVQATATRGDGVIGETGWGEINDTMCWIGGQQHAWTEFLETGPWV